MNKNLFKPISVCLFLIFLQSCKFSFEESEYLGTYIGDFTSKTSLYVDSDAQIIVTDAGENLIDIELTSTLNPTFYFTNLEVTRGFGLTSHLLRVNSQDLSIWFNRNTDHISFVYYGNSSYAEYYFYGTR